MADRFESLFDAFWEDIDFLSLSEWQDMPVEQAEQLKRWLRVPDDGPLFEALERGTVSQAFAHSLRGLMTEEEVEEALALRRRTGCVPE